MKKPSFYLWFAFTGILAVATWSSCTDFTTIGSDLLEEDQLGLDFVDTVTLVAGTVTEDTVLTYSGENFALQLNRFLFGDYSDPVFGRTVAGVYAQVLLNRDRSGIFPVLIPPDFKDAVLDSIVLVLTLDSAGFYGNLPQTFGIEVFRVTEDMDASKNYYSNASFATQAVPIGSAQFVSRIDSLEVIDYSRFSPDTISYPQLRIALDPALGQELIQLDTLLYQSDTSFAQVFKGIYLKPTLPTESLVALNWGSRRPGIFLYYNNSEGLPRQYQFEINESSARISSFRHEYAGSRVETFLQNPAAGDTMVLVQGMAGVNAKIEFPHITSLRGAIVNYAQLEIPIGAAEGDDLEKFSPARQLILTVPNSEGVLENISDVRFSAGNQFSFLFGGVVVKGENGQPDVYRMNVSSQIADMINGLAPNVMYLRVNAKAQTGSRAVLNGPQHPLNRMRLRIAFTKP